MGKIISLLVLMATLALSTSAQEQFSGKVINKKGNPMQGVMVESSTGQRCITDFEGKYYFDSPVHINQVTAYYAGYMPKALKNQKKSKTKDYESKYIEQDIKLSKRTWINSRPETWQFFVGAQGLFDETGIEHIMPGITIGMVKEIGIYGKVFFRPYKYANESKDYVPSDYFYTGKYDSGGISLTGGFMIRLGCPVYLNLGYGIYTREIFMQYYDNGNKWLNAENCKTECKCVDVGLNIRFNHLVLNAGAMVIDSNWPEDNDLQNYQTESSTKFIVNVGVSYCF